MLEICFKIIKTKLFNPYYMAVAPGLFYNKNQLKHITFINLKLIGLNSNIPSILFTKNSFLKILHYR